MSAWIAATVFATTSFFGGQLKPYGGGQEIDLKNPRLPLGSVVKAIVSESSIRQDLMTSANLARAVNWQTLVTLGPDRVRYGNNYLIFYKPSCVDAGGLADLLGMPGGWHSEPGDDQSYLLTYVSTTAGRRYGLVFEIWRYQEDSGPAQFEFEGPNGRRTRNLTGSGTISYSFVAPAGTKSAVVLRMASKGRYLFRKVDVRLASP